MRSALLLCALLLASCESEQAPGDLQAHSADLEHLRGRVELHYETVDLIKPRVAEGFELDVYLAPMFYREAQGDPAPGFGALQRGDGGWAVDPGRPTVYFERGSASLGDSEHEQWTWRWFFPGDSPGEVAVQGLRMTFDAQGFPAILEVLEDSSGASLFFVSKPLAQRASEEFGPPLPGRAHSVEPPFDERPDVIVPRIVGQGPAPLGPFLYLAAAGHDLQSLHCRCSPSQMTSIREVLEYEVAALEEPPEGLRDFEAPEWPLLSLRLPASF